MNIENLVDKHGKVPTPTEFGRDGNALSLVSVTASHLRKGSWPADAINQFRDIALSGDYDNVVQTCTTCFGD
jgi:hypothetical protein